MKNPKVNKIIIGADHLGKDLKDSIKEHINNQGYKIEDIGVSSNDLVDYPDIGSELAKRISNKEFDRGILVCGTGAGMAIVANKFNGVRAVSVNDAYTAERAIASNNAQVITFGALITGAPNAKMYTDIWLSNDFQSERSGHKVAKIDAIDS